MDGEPVQPLEDYSVAMLISLQKTHPVMVFRRRMSNALRPVHRIKHVIDNQFGVVIGTPTTVNLILAVDAPVLANVTEVETGSKVNGIYLKVEVNATTSAALSNAYMMVFKNPGGNLTFGNPNVIGADDNKRYVIHQEMVMLQQQDGSNPRTLFNGVIVIPRGYRRFGPNDILQIEVFSPGVTLNACLQAHYKEFR